MLNYKQYNNKSIIIKKKKILISQPSQSYTKKKKIKICEVQEFNKYCATQIFL